MILQDYIPYVKIRSIYGDAKICSLLELKENSIRLSLVDYVYIFKYGRLAFDILVFQTDTVKIRVQIYSFKDPLGLQINPKRHYFKPDTSLYEALFYFKTINKFIIDHI